MDTKHTPAPWRFLPKVGYVMGADGESQFGPREVQIGVVGNYRDDELLPFNRERWDADGRLIAAAPDLLHALKSADEWMSAVEGPLADGAPFKRDRAMIRAALAKATQG